MVASATLKRITAGLLETQAAAAPGTITPPDTPTAMAASRALAEVMEEETLEEGFTAVRSTRRRLDVGGVHPYTPTGAVPSPTEVADVNTDEEMVPVSAPTREQQTAARSPHTLA